MGDVGEVVVSFLGRKVYGDGAFEVWDGGPSLVVNRRNYTPGATKRATPWMTRCSGGERRCARGRRPARSRPEPGSSDPKASTGAPRCDGRRRAGPVGGLHQ